MNFFKRNCSASIHTRNLKCFVTEMYKLAKAISSTLTQENFRFRYNRRYNLSSQDTFQTSCRKSIYSRTESISYSGQKCCELGLDHLKSITTASSFKEESKKGNTENFPC